MKIQRIKDIITGSVITAIVIGTGATAFAKATNMNIPVSFNNIKIIVDGKAIETDKEPFIYDGTTYLPVRAVGEAIGKEVSWDGNTNTVILGGKAGTETKPTETKPTETTSEYSRTNPAPVGTSQTIDIDNYLEKYTAQVKVIDVLTGEQRKAVMGSTTANDRVDGDYDFVIAEVEVKIISVENSDKAVSVNSYDFKEFTSNNESVDKPYIYLTDGQLNEKLYEGGVAKGYVVCKVKIGDTAPKMVYGSNYDGTGGAWFNLTK